MYKFLPIYIICFFIHNKFYSQVEIDYYKDIKSSNGYLLKKNLNKLINLNTISYNYSEIPYIFSIIDVDSFYEKDGSMLDIYSENPTSTDPYNYYYDEDKLISGAGEEGLGWNREHIFSQSFFNGNYPMYTDAHLLLPTDARVNQRRSNLPFGLVKTPAFTSLNGTKVGNSATEGYTNSVFEPIDEFKGDIARILLYVAVKYEHLINYFNTDNIRNPIQANKHIGLKDWQLAQLLQWHYDDPVSEKEIFRNNKIYEFQKNRNPFIDHPEWIDSIWNHKDIAPLPVKPTNLNIIKTGQSFVHLQWDIDSSGNTLGYNVYMNDSLISTTDTNFFVATDLINNSIYSFHIQSYNNELINSLSSETVIAKTLESDTFSQYLLFTKMIFGSENNNAIEITNHTGYPVDLSKYTINRRDYNSSAEVLYWNNNVFQMHGYLAPNHKAVLVNPKFDLECFNRDSARFITSAPSLVAQGMTAIRLSYLDKAVDYWGAYDMYNPEVMPLSWYRDSSIKNPNRKFDSTEWIIYEANYCIDLGKNPVDEKPIEPELPDTPNNIPIFDNDSNIISVYPNPVKIGSTLFINIEINSNILLVNNLGIIIDKLKSNNQSIKIPTSISSGQYWIQCHNKWLPIMITD